MTSALGMVQTVNARCANSRSPHHTLPPTAHWRPAASPHRVPHLTFTSQAWVSTEWSSCLTDPTLAEHQATQQDDEGESPCEEREGMRFSLSSKAQIPLGKLRPQQGRPCTKDSNSWH